MSKHKFKCRKAKDMVFDFVVVTIMVFIGIVTIYPFINVLAISFNDASDSLRGGIYIWPRIFTLRNYKEVFSQDLLLIAFKNSLIRTVAGTSISVISTMMVAYVIGRRELIGRKFVSTMLAVTLYVSGGMIPEFLLIRDLKLFNTFAVYIVPGVLSVYFIFIIRSFIEDIPYALQEAAQIDGANDIVIFFRVILPLCLPAIATIGLFYAVGHWNSWIDTYLYASSKSSLTTLQYELMKILQSTSRASVAKIHGQQAQLAGQTVSPESIRMAITIVATVPIIIVYPFVQKYFVKGLTLGGVKS
ncbi:MAG: carbohydrate ABC transporter permease [Oscillospiraceae bacterium]